MQKNPKNKLKTLPNELPSHKDAPPALFQSQTDDHYMKTIDLSSPTFATHELRSYDYQYDGNDNGNGNGDCIRTQKLDDVGNGNGNNKENRVVLSLKELRSGGNGVPELRHVNQLGNCFQSSKKNDLLFFKGQNQKLVDKCKILDMENKQLQQDKKILQKKLKISKKCLQQKNLQKMQKFLHLKNSSQTDSNIDIYLQMKAFKQSYRTSLDSCQQFQSENRMLKEKVRELQDIITAYTQKSEKKRLEGCEQSEKAKEIERVYEGKMEDLRGRVRVLEGEMKEKDKGLKKVKQQYERLKFLKEEIEKKRQQDIKIRQQLQQSLVQKQSHTTTLQQALTSTTQQLQHQVHQLTQSLSTLESENGRLKHTFQNAKLTNQKYMAELGELRKENQGLYDGSQELKMEKDRLECVIGKHLSNEERLVKKIGELQGKYNLTEKQLQQVKQQFQQYMKNAIIGNNTNRSSSCPQISKFNEPQHQHEHDNENDHQNQQEQYSKQPTNQLLTEKIRSTQQKYNKIVEELNREIEELRKCKKSLEGELQSQRQRYEKVNLQLQNTYRRMEEIGGNYDRQRDRDRDGERQKYGSKRMTDLYLPTSHNNPNPQPQLTRPTKATPQLKMIRQILSTILKTRPPAQPTIPVQNKLYQYHSKQKQQLHNIINNNTSSHNHNTIEYLIDDIKRQSEQIADLFDDRTKQLQTLIQKISHKEQVISKLLRFTPEQKKHPILQYLKVMQDIDDYDVEHLYKVTKNLQEEAQEWKRYVNGLAEELERCEEELVQLRWQVSKGKILDTGTGIGRKGERLGYGRGEKSDKFQRQRERDRQRDKHDRFQYRRH